MPAEDRALGADRPLSPHVLVVEDDPDVLDITTGALSDAGYRVTAAAGARQGLDALERHALDVVVTDLEMPDGSGQDIIRRARALPKPPPVIGITGLGEAERPRALVAGAIDLLPKPFNLSQLLLVLQAATNP